MTNEEFCKVFSNYYEEKITDINQVAQTSFTGEELKDIIEFFIEELLPTDYSNQAY